MLSLTGSDWVFQPLSYSHFQFVPTLHVGDYDMDGFPDVVTVLSSPTLVLLLRLAYEAIDERIYNTRVGQPF